MIDFEMIKQQSADNNLPMIKYIVGVNGKIEGEDYVTLNPTRNDAKLGSFRININTGKFHDYATGEGGGNIIDLAMYIEKISAKEAAEKLIQAFPFLASSSDRAETPARKEEQPRCDYIWNQSKKEAHVYLDRKRITIGNARVNNYKGKKSLVIPLVNTIPTSEKDLQIEGFQYIQEDGQKHFPNGREVKGLFHIASDYEVPRDKIVVAEGYATARSIAIATGLYTVATMSANNMEAVTKKIYELTHSQIIIAADNDEPGIKFAKKAAQLAKGTKIVYPAKKGDDFNDMYVSAGTEAVKTIFDNYDSQEMSNDDTEATTSSKFKLEKNGLFYEDEKVCDYIEIVGLVKKYEGNLWKTKIRFNDMDKIEKEIDVDNRKIKNIGDLVDDLISAGFYPNIKHKLLRDYILQSLSNRSNLKRYIEIDKTGWINDCDVYICPSFSCTKNQDNQFILSNNVQNMGYSQRGTLEEWQQNVAEYSKGNNILIFALCAALSPIALKLLPNIGNTIFHFIGGSSIGKTTALKVAASVWGKPREYLRTWRATGNAQECLAESHNDALLILDEIGQASSSDIGNTVYMLGNGQGKSRMNQYSAFQHMKRWRTVCLSSGEVNFTEKIGAAKNRPYDGMLVRLIDINSDMQKGMGIFEYLHSCMDARELSTKLTINASKYYGTAAEEFVKYIQNIDENDFRITYEASLENLKEYTYNEFGIAVAHDGKVGRVLQTFAFIHAVGMKACTENSNILPFNDEEIDSSVKKILQHSNLRNDADKNKEIVEYVQETLMSCNSVFPIKTFNNERDKTIRLISEEKSKYGEIYGYSQEGGHYYIYNRFFNKLFCDKYRENEVRKALQAASVMIKYNENGKLKNQKYSIDGLRVSLVHLHFRT